MNEHQTLMIQTFRAFEAREARREPKPKSKAMRMTFGRHLGKPLDQVPRGYLRWVVDNVRDLEPTLAAAIQKAVSGEPIPEDVVVEDADLLEGQA